MLNKSNYKQELTSKLDRVSSLTSANQRDELNTFAASQSLSSFKRTPESGFHDEIYLQQNSVTNQFPNVLYLVSGVN